METRKKENQQEGVICSTGKDGYTTEIKAGKHNLVADEPESVGGKNQGPTPYDYLIIALGTCTSMTLRMYADRKGWPLEEVKVYLKHEKMHAKDCENCDDSGAKLDHITRDIELIGNLDSDQKKRLMDIADRCPVHKTLQNKIHVKTALKNN